MSHILQLDLAMKLAKNKNGTSTSLHAVSTR